MQSATWIRRLLFLACFSPLLAQAQSESAITLKAGKVIEPQAFDQDVDEILTNKQMRAASGSKSRWSIASSFDYMGGNLSSPFAENRPNIAGATGATDNSLIDGNLSAKFAITPTHAFFAGVGVRWLTPFQGTAAPNHSTDKVDANNPYLNYQYIYRTGSIESVVTASSTYFTDSNLVSLGYVTSLGLSQNSVYKVPSTHLSVGAMAYTGLGFYNKDDEKDREGQSDYSFGFLPFVEYQINDRLNFRTSWNLWIFEHIRSESNADTYRWDKVTQSLGLGISVTRDFFLFPNIQFIPDDIRSDRTNIALSTNINIF